MSRSVFDIGQRSLRFQHNIFFSDTVGCFETKFCMKDYRRMGMKIFTNELCQVTKMAAMPILYVVKHVKIVLKNQ